MTGGREPRTLRFLHLSDLHFIVGEQGRAKREKHVRSRLCEDLRDLLKENPQDFHAIVVTGDIAYHGRLEEYSLADPWFTELASDLLDVNDERVLVIPGNHDVNWDQIGPDQLAHREQLASCAEGLLDDTIDRLLDHPSRSALEPLLNYSEFAAGREAGFDRSLCWEVDLELGGGYRVRLRGATSVLNSGEDDGFGTMAIQRDQLQAEDQAGLARLLMIHHSPPYWRRQLPTPSDCGQHVVLYGHTHQPTVRVIDNCVEITAGAVHPEEDATKTDSTYNIIELHIEEPDPESDVAMLVVRTVNRRFTQDTDHFGPGLDRTDRVRIPRASAEPEVQDVTVPQPDEPVPEHPTAAVTNAPELRSPLETPEGAPNPLRVATLAFEQLGAGRRSRVLVELGLMTDERARMSADQLIRSVAAEVIESDRVSEFLEAVERQV